MCVWGGGVVSEYGEGVSIWVGGGGGERVSRVRLLQSVHLTLVRLDVRLRGEEQLLQTAHSLPARLQLERLALRLRGHAV